MIQPLTVRELTAAVWTPAAICILVTLGRFAIRFQKRRLSWDDALNGFALALLLGYTGMWQAVGPFEYHIHLYFRGILDHLPERMVDETILINLNIAKTLIFWCVIYAVKASLLAMYWTIFKMSPTWRKFWAASVVYTVLAFLITFLWGFWQCGNISDFLNEEACEAMDPGFLKKMLIGWCVIDIVGDVILIALPCFMLTGMLSGTRQKLELATIFSLVILNIAFELLRTVYSITGDAMRFLDQYDMFCSLQACTAVIVCALPCYGGLLRFGRKSTRNTPVLNHVTDNVPSSFKSGNTTKKEPEWSERSFDFSAA